MKAGAIVVTTRDKEVVLIVSNVTGGLISFRRELIEALVEKYHVVVLAAETGGKEVLLSLGCEYIETDVKRQGTNIIEDLKLFSEYKRIIKKIRPKVVLTYTIKPNVYAGAACAKLGIPYIANITGLGTAVENGGILQKLALHLYRYGLRKAQMVFFQNNSNLAFMISKGIVKGPYDLLPGSGVNLTRYQVLDYPEEATVDFVFIARIRKEKGIEEYLAAANAIHEKYPFTRFHICGYCEQNYEVVIKSESEKNYIIYHGTVNDISAIHRISQCTIHPSYYPEGMSNVLLESAACGRPVITTDKPGCKEIVADGVTGYIVNQRDSEDLIRAVEKFLNLSWEERKTMGLKGREKVETEFDRSIVVNKYLTQIELA